MNENMYENRFGLIFRTFKLNNETHSINRQIIAKMRQNHEIVETNTVNQFAVHSYTRAHLHTNVRIHVSLASCRLSPMKQLYWHVSVDV